MKIAVIGTGYVGLVVGACFSDLGNNVICVDVNEKKISALKQGKIPIFEPGLGELVKRGIETKSLLFSTDVDFAVKQSSIIFIAVGTPELPSGEADLNYVRAAAESIGRAMNGHKIIVNKSTVPIGTGDLVSDTIKKFSKEKFDVVSNPEFLREGSAVYDFMHPDRIVVGNGSEEAAQTMADLYAPLKAKIIFTDLKSAEMIKYASNAFLPARISLINEIANLCEIVGANVSDVAEGIGLDKRIGKYFLNAGCGWGGSCFPKDLSSLIAIGKTKGYNAKILEAVKKVNEEQKLSMVSKTEKALGDLNGKKIAVLGLAFKPDTDDMREAPSLVIIPLLQEKGARIVAVDPVAIDNAKKHFKDVKFCKNVFEALDGADLMLVLTDWNQFKKIDLGKVKEKMNKPVVVDGRNIYDKENMNKLGFTYIGVGR